MQRDDDCEAEGWMENLLLDLVLRVLEALLTTTIFVRVPVGNYTHLHKVHNEPSRAYKITLSAVIPTFVCSQGHW